MKGLVLALVLSCWAMPAGAATIIIDGTHAKSVKFDGFDVEIPFTMEVINGGSSANFMASFDGLITADPRWCADFPPGEEPKDCSMPIDLIHADDIFTAEDWPTEASMLLPFSLSGTGRGLLHFSATDGATVRITIDNATPAPEPASWAMMLGGFGLVGAAMRSAKRVGRRQQA